MEDDELLDDKVQLESLETSGRTPVSKKDELLLSRISLSLTVEQSESLGLAAATSYEFDLTIVSLAGFLFSSIESLRLCVSSKLRATFLCSKSETCDLSLLHSPFVCKKVLSYILRRRYWKEKCAKLLVVREGMARI